MCPDEEEEGDYFGKCQGLTRLVVENIPRKECFLKNIFLKEEVGLARLERGVISFMRYCGGALGLLEDKEEGIKANS